VDSLPNKDPHLIAHCGSAVVVQDGRERPAQTKTFLWNDAWLCTAGLL